MSGVFGAYAQYYDLLYKDKDYVSEAVFVETLLRRYATDVGSVLELGCGTGAHALLLAANGYKIHGVDISAGMLEVARQSASALPDELSQRLSFSQGDVRKFDLGQQFDAILSLFHVVSYQATNDDLFSMFHEVSRHLRPGGVFIFDYWFGPAVLTEQPTVRLKRVATDTVRVTRIAQPALDVIANCVDVNYQVFVHNEATHSVTELAESHRMRYLFQTEIDMLARAAGFTVQSTCEWLTGRDPGVHTWSVCSVLRK